MDQCEKKLKKKQKTKTTSSLSHTLADRLERFQRRAAKACTRIPTFAHIDHTLLLHTVDWPMLFCRRKIKHVLFAHSILYNYAAPHILDMSLPALAFSTYRRTRVYELPSARTDRQLTSPINASLAYLNQIPKSMTDIPDRNAFKSVVQPYLLNSICSCSAHPHPYV